MVNSLLCHTRRAIAVNLNDLCSRVRILSEYWSFFLSSLYLDLRLLLVCPSNWSLEEVQLYLFFHYKKMLSAAAWIEPINKIYY